MSASQPEVWRPTPAQIDAANVTRLMRAHDIERFEDLVARSITDPAWFWDAVVRDLDLEFSTPYDRVVDLARGPAWATWFIRRAHERRSPVRRPLGGAHADVPCGRVGRRGWRRPLGNVRGPPRTDGRRCPSAGLARRGQRRQGRDLPADGDRDGRGGDGVREGGSGLRSHLQRLRARRPRREAGGRGVPGPDHGERLAPQRRAGADEGDRGPSDRDGAGGRARARLGAPGGLRPASPWPGPRMVGDRRSRRTCPRRDAARCRAPAVHRLHERHDRTPERSGPRPRRVPREDRRGGRLPGRPASRRAAALVDRPWLDHGPVGDRRRSRARRHRLADGGRADPPGARPAVGTGGAARGHDARGLADTRARVDRGRLRPRSPRRKLLADLGVDRRAHGPGRRTSGCTAKSATSGSRS